MTKKRRPKAQREEVKRRGAEIAKNPENIKTKNGVRWKVRSQTAADMWYAVVLCAAGLVCECPYNNIGHGICKHIIAVMHEIGRTWTAGSPTRIEMPGGCHYCHSKNTVKNGRRRCKRSRKDVQRYLCRDCHHTFSGIPGFKGRHYEPSFITETLADMAKGHSAAAAADASGHEDKPRVHKSTTYRWTGHYSRLMDAYMRTLRPQIGFKWHADEIYFKIRGQKRYLFSVMDGSTRFILSCKISHEKFGCDARGLFRMAAEQAGCMPRILVTDGLRSFATAAAWVFGSSGAGFIHVSEAHVRDQFNHNNIQERLNGEFRDRLITTRGLNADEPALVKLIVIHHNFFRRHEGLKDKTPAHAGGITIEGSNKWATMIANAALSGA